MQQDFSEDFFCVSLQAQSMVIAVNTRFLLPRHLEGIGLYTAEVLKRLVRLMPEDKFLFLFDRPYDKRYLFAPNVRPIVVRPPARHPLLWYAWFEWSIPRVLQRYEADVFFSPDGYLSLRTPVPTLMTLHDLAYLHYPKQLPFAVRHYYRHFIPRYLQRAEHILTVSEYTRQDVLSHFHLPKGKIHTTCNGVRQAFAKWPSDWAAEQSETRRRYSEGKPYFLYVGALHPRKNIAGLIRAFDRFKESTQAPHLLLLTGRKAWMTTEMEKTLASAKYASDVRFTGYLETEALPALYRAAFALTYVSFFEGFGVPLLEAMYSQLPIITSDCSSLPEVAGQAALYVNPHHTESITAAMLRLYHEPQLREKLLRAAQQQREKFSWKRAAKEVFETLKQLTQL